MITTRRCPQCLNNLPSVAVDPKDFSVWLSCPHGFVATGNTLEMAVIHWNHLLLSEKAVA